MVRQVRDACDREPRCELAAHQYGAPRHHFEAPSRTLPRYLANCPTNRSAHSCEQTGALLQYSTEQSVY